MVDVDAGRAPVTRLDLADDHDAGIPADRLAGLKVLPVYLDLQLAGFVTDQKFLSAYLADDDADDLDRLVVDRCREDGFQCPQRGQRPCCLGTGTDVLSRRRRDRAEENGRNRSARQRS